MKGPGVNVNPRQPSLEAADIANEQDTIRDAR